MNALDLGADVLMQFLVGDPEEDAPGLAEEEDEPDAQGSQGEPDFTNNREQYDKELGTKKKRALKLIRDPDTPQRVLLLQLILGPLHYGLTHQFNVASQRATLAYSAACPAPILDLMNERTSFVTVILQYFSHMLMCGVWDSHVKVLAGQFEGDCPTSEMVKALLRLIARASASVFYRFIWRIARKQPFMMLQIADLRRSLAFREGIAKATASSRVCCVDNGATDSVLEQMAT